MFFVLWIWIAPFLIFLGVHARALTSWLAALFYFLQVDKPDEDRMQYGLAEAESEMWWAREVGGGKITLKEDGFCWNGRRIDCLIPLFYSANTPTKAGGFEVPTIFKQEIKV